MKDSVEYPAENLKVALGQLTSTENIESNTQQILSLLESLPVNSGVRLICFPENCLFMRINEKNSIPQFDLQKDANIQKLSAWAQSQRSNIHLGSVPLKIGDQLFNASVLIREDGQVQSTYQKIHLFDISLDSGGEHRESATFSHGASPAIFDLDGWKIGQTICYDLRFAELFSIYARQEVDLVLVPSAFLVKTGEAHWHVLLRARAIENQCYILASAQAGVHVFYSPGGPGEIRRETFGHSMAVDPWGQVLADETKSPSLRILQLTKSVIRNVRRQIPMGSHRRIPSP